MNIKDRIQALRNLMKEKHIDAYIVPSFDAHQSEYVADHWTARKWISGFTGSAGTAVITHDKNGLWTDGRYFIQAANQLEGSGIDLFKMGQPGVPTFEEWLYDVLPENSVVGFDGKVIPLAEYKRMKDKFGKKNIKIESNYDLIDKIWEDRPEIPNKPIMCLDVKYAGKSRTEKIDEVREHMKKVGATTFLLTSLDDIAWLFNIRGNDVSCNPVVTAYALINNETSYLFIDKRKVSSEIEKELNNDNIKVLPYDEIEQKVKEIKDSEKILLDPNKVNVWIASKISKNCELICEANITTAMKAIKNDIEIKNLRNAHVRDGVAVTRFTKWLKENVGKEKITELSASDKLTALRAEAKEFKDISFGTIAGHKEHAAMMHYSATKETAYELDAKGFLLVDSGAQYLDGTTDITRTFILGDLTEEEKRDYTLVLKANIDLAKLRFLYGSTGAHIDAIARQPLWAYGIDYKCGTGHGVGFFLNVHEGPQRVSPAFNGVVLQAGMIVTDEPGVYKEGKHGIRIENELLVQNDIKTESGQFMSFETVTYAPIDLDGVIVDMLTEEEREYLNSYHKMVYDKLAPSLNDEEKAWLKNATREI